MAAMEQLLNRVRGLDTADMLRAGLARLADKLRATGGTPLAIDMPEGGRINLGASPRVAFKIRDPSLVSSFASPSLATLAEAFIQGRLDVDGSLLDAMPMAEQLVEAAGSSVNRRFSAAYARHNRRQDKAAISYHYDVGNDFYRLWLDERMVYSCAYFRDPDVELDDAQLAKLDHICRKLRLSAGEKFVDIGCGWGALAIHAASRYGVSAVGITLSEQQLELGRERVASLGLQDRVQLLLLDYRELSQRFGAGAFDKAASVGMFEHVGLRNLPTYFGCVAEVVRDRGLFLNHGITSVDVDHRPVGSGVSEFIDHYVFPHGELAHLHLATREMSAAGFEVCDVESLRPHYARTLGHWSNRLESRLDDAARIVSDKTLRIWRAYLAGCAHGFAQGWVTIYQLLGSRNRTAGPSDLPWTRDWIYR